MSQKAKGSAAKKPQSDAFVEAAKALGCDESEEHFDDALKKIAQHKPMDDGRARPTSAQSKAPKAPK